MVTKLPEDSIKEWKEGIDLVFGNRLQNSKYKIVDENDEKYIKYIFIVDSVDNISDESMLELRCDDMWLTDETSYKLVSEASHNKIEDYEDEYTVYNIIIGFKDGVVIENN